MDNFQSPTSVGTYVQDRTLEDIPAIKHALSLFCASRMVESEEYCKESDPNREHLYITSGYSLIQAIKALMSFEDKDLQEALTHLNRGNELAAAHRAPVTSFSAKVSGLIWGAKRVDAIRAMTAVQRHAELLFAETTFAKALVGSIASGSWLGFVREALSFRVMINVYLSLGKYLKTVDNEAAAQGLGQRHPDIDDDFRSGVELGVGASNLILSLMPKTVLSVVELFGYQGDRNVGLEMLYGVGGWEKGAAEPRISADKEGLRRPLADICLLCFHLVLSSFVHQGVDIPLAQQILEWNLKRFPDGVFFLFGAGRLRLLRSQPAQATAFYERAMSIQSQYPNLHYISFWELAVCNFARWNIPQSLVYWRKLRSGATWSRACYAYGVAACLLQIGSGTGSEGEEAREGLREIPKLMNKIAGKSIPIEKFVARKARKFEAQGGRLALPALEFAYFFLAIQHAPRDVILQRMMPEVDAQLARLRESEPNTYEGGKGYWDDLCLAQFLEGVCMRFVAYPDRDAELQLSDAELQVAHRERGPASVRALRALKAVVENAHTIELDHYITYHAHYELGRLYACFGNRAKAVEHLKLVASGKSLEPANKSRKGKYSMQTALVVRAGASLEGLGDPDAN
ncbi:hypothetical protein BD309DRAFT_998854 [Dichomitus squalens]|uniref:Uncharacterized protein n=1 Tax=Dichomitus squalens TaxID=114155 RepID=A0A4Q9P2G9_9APHY|nr:hypothetical protein BD309DRAFT_998854 [Dichomitus squalens]TBU60513.1 hypothetical protein BD310DRAFT_875223 [Dichomitus squalens]